MFPSDDVGPARACLLNRSFASNINEGFPKVVTPEAVACCNALSESGAIAVYSLQINLKPCMNRPPTPKDGQCFHITTAEKSLTNCSVSE